MSPQDATPGGVPWADGDLEATHAAALNAGGTEVTQPRDAEGMPRASAVKDPSGNWIWLYQGWRGPRRVRSVIAPPLGFV